MPKILLIEDEEAIAAAVSKELLRNQHTVDKAASVSSAEDFLAAAEYDLLICDWNLPDGQGVDLIDRLRSKGRTIPVLMLTGNSQLQHKERGFQSGTDDYLTKPFLMRELVLRTEALLRRPHSYTQALLTVGDLALNTQSYQVTKAGALLKLPPREFALLHFLMRHPNTVFSAESLIERVWPTDSEVTSDALRKYVHRLREKIETPDGTCRIRTVHGTGYSLETK